MGGGPGEIKAHCPTDVEGMLFPLPGMRRIGAEGGQHHLLRAVKQGVHLGKEGRVGAKDNLVLLDLAELVG